MRPRDWIKRRNERKRKGWRKHRRRRSLRLHRLRFSDDSSGVVPETETNPVLLPGLLDIGRRSMKSARNILGQPWQGKRRLSVRRISE